EKSGARIPGDFCPSVRLPQTEQVERTPFGAYEEQPLPIVHSQIPDRREPAHKFLKLSADRVDADEVPAGRVDDDGLIVQVERLRKVPRGPVEDPDLSRSPARLV